MCRVLTRCACALTLSAGVAVAQAPVAGQPLGPQPAARVPEFRVVDQERDTVSSIVTGQEAGIGNGPTLAVGTAHVFVQAAASDGTVAPGSRFSLSIEITPRKGMHVYAPGPHTYQTVGFTVAGQGLLEAGLLRYPPSEIYYFAPLDERVEVYQRVFTLVQDLAVLATPDAQKTLAGRKTLTVTGQLEYQACDDRVCYAPAQVPLAFTLDLTPRPPR